jgi:hypothetical protein
LLDETIDNRQAETGAATLLLGSEERLEHAWPGSARVAQTLRASDVDNMTCSPSVLRSMSVMPTTWSLS